MTERQIDLRELALERPAHRASTRRHRRPWVTRYVVPSAVLVGFATLLVIAAGEHLLPRQTVTVVPVVVTRAEVRQEGTPLFQAAGWIEPRPTPINVPALTAGVVKNLEVVEGQHVKAGEAVAQLIDVDAELALRQAETSYKLQKAELGRAEAALKAARLRKDNPVHLEAELADAESLRAKTETALAQLPYLIQSSRARLEYARQNFEGKRAARDAIEGRRIQEAESEFAKAKAELEELQQRKPRLEREMEALQNKVDALAAQLKLLIEESRQLEDAEARYKGARAELESAELVVEKARLALDRTVVRAPITGRVLNLVAFPGTKVMGLDATAGQNSSTVVELYDPGMLQVRADVRLEDVPLVRPGQPIEIDTASAKQPILGTVLAPTSSANIQKNTLEVKVAIHDPPSTISPEMLVTATFLAPPRASSEVDESQKYERLLIPRQLVRTDESGSSVWIVDPDGTARRQAIELGKAGTEELVEAIDGIRSTDKLISSGHQGLQPGTRVTIAGEDAAIGFRNSRS